MKEGEREIKEILKDIKIGNRSQVLRHYVWNYAAGALCSSYVGEFPETSETERWQIYDLCKTRVAILLQLKENVDDEKLHTYLTQQYNAWNIGVQVLEDYFSATN